MNPISKGQIQKMHALAREAGVKRGRPARYGVRELREGKHPEDDQPRGHPGD